MDLSRASHARKHMGKFMFALTPSGILHMHRLSNFSCFLDGE